jgi:hypothetical protein
MADSVVEMENRVKLFELAERLEKITCVPQEIRQSLDETKKQLQDLITLIKSPNNEERVYVRVQSKYQDNENSQFFSTQMNFISLHFFVYHFIRSSVDLGFDQKNIDFQNFSRSNQPSVLISMKKADYQKILDNLGYKSNDVVLHEITKDEYEHEQITQRQNYSLFLKRF